MKKTIAAVTACLLLMWFALPAEAALTLPNYATGGNLSSSIQTKGKAITDTVSMIVAILSIIGITIGGGFFAVGNGEKGKMFLIGGTTGIIVAGAAYGIASLVA